MKSHCATSEDTAVERQQIRNTSFRPNSSLRTEALQHQGSYEVNRDIETVQRVDEVEPIYGVKDYQS